MWDYTDKVKDHFLNPHNVGVIEGADGVGEVGSLACGDALKLTFKMGQDGKIADAKFETFGCGSAIASSSILTDMVKGLTIEEAEKITNKDIADALGGLPDQKMHCSVMGREALEAAIANYRGGSADFHQLHGKTVCTCYGVQEDEIERVIRENNLKTVIEVTNYCKAGGGCGGCIPDIKKIITRVRGEISPANQNDTEAKPKPAKPLTGVQKMKLIEQALDQHVRPALQVDGGDVEFIDLQDNTVTIAFRGMCAQCKVSEFTMSQVVEKKLREYVNPDLVVQEQKE